MHTFLRREASHVTSSLIACDIIAGLVFRQTKNLFDVMRCVRVAQHLGVGLFCLILPAVRIIAVVHL